VQINRGTKISRRPLTRATESFEKAHFDLIQMTQAYNWDKWALHVLEDASRVNYLYTIPSKSQTLQCIKDFYEMVLTQYNRKIKQFNTMGSEHWEMNMKDGGRIRAYRKNSQ
jgi:hypothetical protein